MTKLRISEALALPEDAVTRTFVVYGGKGKGKTNFGAVLCEELAARGLRFCVTDPLDVWWGLQHGRTKDEQGIDVVILGGQHADEAITPDAGEVIADFVADEPVNTVIVMRHADGRMWSNGERIRFMSKFTRRLFARQGERRIPLMLVIDEAGRFVPQIAPKGAIDVAECIGAIEELVEWGRNVGLGCCLITQRSARMNKSVSELAECMVAFQTAGPNSISAIVDWFGEHIAKPRQNELIGILRRLPVGRALVVSPEWLDFEGEAPIRLRRTFDSSATPKAGGALRAPGRARKPDLAKYRARLAEVAERAKADDPKALRAQIRELEARVGKAERTQQLIQKAQPNEVVKRVEVPVLRDGSLTKLRHISEQWVRAGAAMLEAEQNALDRMLALQGLADELGAAIAPVRNELARITREPAPTGAPAGVAHASAVAPVRAGSPVQSSPATPATTRQPASGVTDPRAPERRPVTTAAGGQPARTEGITGPQQRILDALASLESIGVGAATKVQLALFAKASPTSSSYQNNTSALRTGGLIEYPAGGLVRLTEAGRAIADARQGPSTVDEVHAFVQQLVSGPQWRIVRALVEAYPSAVAKADLAAQAEASPTSSSFQNNLSTLRSLRLIDYPDHGHAVALPVLFLEGHP